MFTDLDEWMEPWSHTLPIAEYEFFESPQPKERSPGQTKIRTRNFEDFIAKVVQDSGELKAKRGSRIGVRVVLTGKYIGDLSNCYKSIEDGMNRTAYHDDKAVDYFQVVRCNPRDNPRIVVQILERE